MSPLPDHLCALDADWAVWRPVALRMAGFPIDLWLTLARAEVAEVVDRHIDDADGLTACQASFDRAAATLAERLVEIARQPRFREAVLWQNASVVGNVLDRLTAGRDSTMRRRHAVVARYLQRYCTKNDTIGFFGPIAWARVVDEPVGLRCARTDLALATRATRLEGWAVEQLAGAIARRPEVGRALTVPFSTLPERFEPLAQLREVIAALPDGARAIADELPARIQGEVEAVAAAAGDPVRLEAALGALHTDFVAATGAAQSRSPGRVYAGRGVVFEDCRSALEVTLGTQVLDALRGPLGLLLASVRWATARIGAEARQHLVRVFRAIGGGAPVPADELWPRFVDANAQFQALHEAAFADVAATWRDLLAPDLAARRLTYTSEALRARVRRAFAAPRCGWRFARYHSPDVLIDAADADAIRAGDFRLVLGEIHPGRNTMLRAFFVPQHPDPGALTRALRADLGPAWIGGVAPPVHPPLRTTLLGDYTILRVPGALPVAPEQRSLDVADYEVVPDGDGLGVRRRDGGGAPLDVLEFFCFHASSVFTSFHLLPAAAHLPRIAIDRLVVQREAWFVDARTLDFHRASSALARYREVRRLKRALDLPRFVYAKASRSAPTGFLAPLVGATPDHAASPSSASEKPVFLDLDNPLSTEELARLARDSARAGAPGLRITEMLPAPEGLWLHNDAGERFTTELRFACLDRASTFDDEPPP